MRGGLRSKNNLRLLLSMFLKFYSGVAKSNEVIKVWGLIPTGRNGIKTGKRWGSPFCPPILNRVMKTWYIKHIQNFEAEVQNEFNSEKDAVKNLSEERSSAE